MYFLAVFIAKLLSPFVFVFAIAAHVFSSKPVHIGLWVLVYVIFTEVALHSLQPGRTTELLPAIAAALAFVVAYGVVKLISISIQYIKARIGE